MNFFMSQSWKSAKTSRRGAKAQMRTRRMLRRMKRAMREKLGWSRPWILSRVRRARFLIALNLFRWVW